ncbi:hypothetical protein B0H66DRAFT_289380 [Apodospora peruviana]|uniref:Uncharacterized protein n=1 Tax=Apodospora peruviana TaxID=516989 RepID=A0AAE0I0I7_9PEZI|nr:hypothetical protein B0H66DRAFT_289380 [Apodospora peruviana]
MPPTNYYHLKFELYPTPDPRNNNGGGLGNIPSQIWVPTANSTIFDDLPSHPPRPASKHTGGAVRKRSEGLPAAAGGVIDCGASRARSTARSPTGDVSHNIETDNHHSGKSKSSHRDNYEILTERQWRARSRSSPPPGGFRIGIGPRTAVKDWRFGSVNIESFDLVSSNTDNTMDGGGGKMTKTHEEQQQQHAEPAASLGPNLGGMGQATKARYLPLETKNTEVGWGIVHLYRECDESSALSAAPPHEEKGGSSAAAAGGSRGGDVGDEDDGTVLCIPSVPAYISPRDFLGWVGEKWRGHVSHYRMVMTNRMNRYMVLMKLRDHKRATEWREEFDGKPFNDVSELCHVAFIKSITVETPETSTGKKKGSEGNGKDPIASSGIVNSLKPFPPPTPSLEELPTCTVCLERMDNTAGLMTILCQHVFHCTCLQTWRGFGCPICRATTPASRQDEPDNPYSQQPFGSRVSNLCTVCDSTEDLWICLICGNVGCGRYKGGHAKEHWKQTAHCFSLEVETQHIWDYSGDMWVHRLIRDKGDKVVDLSSNNTDSRRRRVGGGGGEGAATGANNGQEHEEDVVPRSKLDNISMELTHLLTSQLESQRMYFEEMVNKAADKAATATSAAESASAQAQEALAALVELKEKDRVRETEIMPALEKDLARERNRANKASELARKLGKSLQEEKEVVKGLMDRIGHLNKQAEEVAKTLAEYKAEVAELRETNHDLTMFISGQEKLKEMESEGLIEEGELEEGTAVAGPGRGQGGSRRGRRGRGN